MPVRARLWAPREAPPDTGGAFLSPSGSTLNKNNLSNIWKFRYKHWKFIPYVAVFSHSDAKCEIFFRKAIIQKELARVSTKVSPFSEESFSVLFLLYLPKKFWKTNTVENHGRIYLYIVLAADGGYFRHNEYRVLGCNCCGKRV